MKGEEEDYGLEAVEAGRSGAEAWSPGCKAPRLALRASADTAALLFVLAAFLGACAAPSGFKTAALSSGWLFLLGAAASSPIVGACACLAIPRSRMAQVPRAAKALAFGSLTAPLIVLFVACELLCLLRLLAVGPPNLSLGEDGELLCRRSCGRIVMGPLFHRMRMRIGQMLDHARRCERDCSMGDPGSMTQAGAWRAARSWLAKGRASDAAKVWLARPFNPEWRARVPVRFLRGAPRPWLGRFGRDCSFRDALATMADALPSHESKQAGFLRRVAQATQVEADARAAREASQAGAERARSESAPRRAARL